MAIAKQARRLASKIARVAAHSYIAGPTIDDALPICCRFLQSGWSCSLGPWNSDADSASEVFDLYVQALGHLSGPDMYLSVKLPALNFDLGMFRDLVEMAQAHQTRIHLDSLSFETAEKTMKAFQVITKSFGGIGYTLPARWRRSARDAAFLKEAGAPVRIVKGQWAEAGNAPDMRAEYLKLVSWFTDSHCHVEVATHDPSLAEKCITLLSAARTSFALGQLYGLPYSIARRRRQRPIELCLYIPYGESYLPYALSRVAKQPQTVWWLIRDAARSSGYFRERPVRQDMA